MKSVTEMVTKNSQLCWDCEKACGRCSWSKNFTPVEGWKAKPTKMLISTTNGKGGLRKYYSDTYEIHECPEFEPLKIKNEAEFMNLLKRNIGRIGSDLLCQLI